MVTALIEGLGRKFLEQIQSLGRFCLFLLAGIIQVFVFPVQISKIIEQIWFIGTKSVFVILLTGMFTGMVLGLQGYYALVDFGSEAALGSAVGLSLVRELGPVLCAIMITARAGSAMAAEIGVMRIGEQIDALETMQINPLRFLFAPRLAGAVISFPLLTALFDVIGIFGGYVTGALMLGINKNTYMDKVISSVQMHDITGGFIKALVFGILVISICCFYGYYTHLNRQGNVGARGVSMSTTSAVVQSCVFILMADYVITFFQV